MFGCFSDRVFGPTTTTRHVYDVAAQHVVSGSMEGINGKYNSINSNYSVDSSSKLAPKICTSSGMLKMIG